MLQTTDTNDQKPPRKPKFPAYPDTCHCGEPMGESYIEYRDSGHFELVWECPACGNVFTS